MPQPDQLQQFENYMADGIFGAMALFAGGAVLYKTAVWGLNAYDSFKELREIRRFERGYPEETSAEQLLESSMPIREVIEIIEQREQRENRIRSAMDRRASLGKRGGKSFSDQLFGDLPSTPVKQAGVQPHRHREVSPEEYADDVVATYSRIVERNEQYPDTNGFSPEELDRLTEMAGGPRRAAYSLRFVFDPELLISRAELAE